LCLTLVTYEPNAKKCLDTFLQQEGTEKVKKSSHATVLSLSGEGGGIPTKAKHRCILVSWVHMTRVLKIKKRGNSKRKFATSAGQTGEDPLKKQHVFFDSKDHTGCFPMGCREQSKEKPS